MKQLLEDFFRYYLGERNLERALALLTEDVLSVGTGSHEIAKGKAELRKLMEAEFEELPNPLNYEIYNYTEVSQTEYSRNLFANLQVKLNRDADGWDMQSRLTCTCVNVGEEWKISCLHMSTPTVEQEENSFFPLHYGKKAIGKLSLDSDSKLMELILKALPGGIMGGYLEEGFPLYIINDRMLDILGYTYEEMAEKTDEKMLNVIYSEDQKRVESSINEQLQKNQEYDIVYRAVGKGQRLIWINDIGKKVITEDRREAMISIMTDITERVEYENELINAAERDPLTKLYNRKKAMSLVEEELASNVGGILFICDVDNFKKINDTKGHMVGDQVLRKLASLIQREVSESTITARLGGDEFIIFVPQMVMQEQAVNMMQKIQQEFYEYMQNAAPEVESSLSVGGTVRKADENIWTLYSNADKALYQAKRHKGDLKML